MVERTILAQDVQSILKQNDKILDLNREIFKFVKEYSKPFVLDTSKLDLDNIKPGSVHRRASSLL